MVTRSIAEIDRITGSNSTYSNDAQRIIKQSPELHVHTSAILGVVQALRDNLNLGRLRSLGLNRYSSQLISFATGISLTIAIQLRGSWLWGLTILLFLFLARSLRLLPYWKGTPRAIADYASIVTALATIAIARQRQHYRRSLNPVGQLPGRKETKRGTATRNFRRSRTLRAREPLSRPRKKLSCVLYSSRFSLLGCS